MYKVASDRRQAGLHHGTLADWMNNSQPDSLEDQRAAVKAALRRLDEELAGELTKERRAEVGLRKLELQNRAAELNKLVGKVKVFRDGLERYFVNVAKEQLLPGQYKLIMDTARRDYDRDAAMIAATLSEADSHLSTLKGEK